MNDTPNTPKISLPSMAELALCTPDGHVRIACNNGLNCPPREPVKITSVNTDEFRDMLPTSEEFYADAKAEFGEMVEPEGPSYDEVAENGWNDAWHDAQEYPF